MAFGSPTISILGFALASGSKAVEISIVDSSKVFLMRTTLASSGSHAVTGTQAHHNGLMVRLHNHKDLSTPLFP